MGRVPQRETVGEIGMKWPWTRAKATAQEPDPLLTFVQEALRIERERLTDMTERYHALRVTGNEAPLPSFVPPENPMTQLGPLTRAALHDMGHGQSGIVKRAMQSKALLIWLDQKNEANRDELTAIAVRQGETR